MQNFSPEYRAMVTRNWMALTRQAVVFDFAMQLIENRPTIAVAIGLATDRDLGHSSLVVDTFEVIEVRCMVICPTFAVVGELFPAVQQMQRQRLAVQIVT